jgi:SAM-dependent methyltransferase
MSERNKKSVPTALPDYYVTVAEDVLRYCRPEPGLWVDLGSGSGGLGLALALASTSTVLLIDPNADALSKALEKARDSGLASRVVPIVAPAERIPLPDACVEVVTSRGSILFWKDPPQGLREVYRILRPGGRAMIGGGFGTAYPEWAREEFFRRSHGPGGLEAQGEEAVRKWNEPRRPEWLTAHAHAAGIETALIEPVPPGRWLLFEKGRNL